MKAMVHMDFEKAKDAASQATEKATEKASEVAETIKEKAGPYAEKAGELATKGVEAAADAAKKVTGGRFDERIDTVAEKVEDVLGRATGSGSESGSGGNA